MTLIVIKVAEAVGMVAQRLNRLVSRCWKVA